MYRTIVVPLVGPILDPDGVSEQALPLARSLADLLEADVVLVSVIEELLELGSLPVHELRDPETWQNHESERNQYLTRIASTFPGRHVETVVRVGEPVTEILHVTQWYEKPIIVMGSHGRTGFKRLILGSTAYGCVERSPCPVIVVPIREDGITDEAPVLDRVLMVVDGSETGGRAIEATLDTESFADQSIHLVRVLEPPPGLAQPKGEGSAAHQAAAESLQDIAQRITPRVQQVSWEVRVGDPGAEIVQAAIEQQSDVIALATQEEGGLRQLIFGSLAENVIEQGPIPLLIFGPALQPMTHVDEPSPVRTYRVADIMSSPVWTVHEQTTLEEVARVMLEHEIGGVPVVDDSGTLQGIITESDFTGTERNVPFTAYKLPQLFGEWLSEEGIERIYAAGRETTANTIMTEHVITATEAEPVTMVVERMIMHDLHRIPVVRDNVPVGIVTRHDLLKILAGTPSSTSNAAQQEQG